MYEGLKQLAKKTKPDISSDVHPVGRYKGFDGQGGSCRWYHDFKTGAEYSENDLVIKDVFNDMKSYCFFSLGHGFKWVLLGVYYPETDIGGIHHMRINIEKGVSKGEIRDFELVDTLWINRDKEIVYSNGDRTVAVGLKDALYYIRGADFVYDEGKSVPRMLMHLFKQKSPCFYFSETSQSCMVTNFWALSDFLFQEEPKGNESKDQESIDRLSDSMPDYIWNAAIPDAVTSSGNMAFVMEKTSAGCVMRGFSMMPCNEGYPPEERYRIFFMKDKAVCTRKNCRQEFIITDEFPNYSGSFVVSFDKDVIKGTVLDNISDYLDMCNGYNIADLILAVQKNPLIENMLKAGMADYVLTALLSSRDWQSFIRNTFNLIREGDDKVGDSFSKLVRLTCRQREMLFERFPVCHTYALAETSNPLMDIKKILGKDAASTDIGTFRVILNLYSLMLRHGGGVEVSNMCITVNRIINELGANRIKKKQAMEYIMESAGRFECEEVAKTVLNFFVEYEDYLQMRKDVCERGGMNFPLMPKDITRVHIELTDYYKARENEINRENFICQEEICRKYEFGDKKYIVVVPKEPEEVYREGSELHHCVSSYVMRVAQGSTNIMFIRKKKKPDKPFFTVEITNEGHVRQIHGLQNRNVDSEPDLVPFVKKWIREKKLQSGNYNEIH